MDETKPAPHKHFSSKDKIKRVLGGLRGQDNIAELCCREGIALVKYCRRGAVKLECSIGA